MKLTMKTPGGERTITLPRWIEDRIFSLFLSSTKQRPIGADEPTASEQRDNEAKKGSQK